MNESERLSEDQSDESCFSEEDSEGEADVSMKVKETP